MPSCGSKLELQVFDVANVEPELFLGMFEWKNRVDVAIFEDFYSAALELILGLKHFVNLRIFQFDQ